MTMVPAPHAPFRPEDFSLQAFASKTPNYAHHLSLFVAETNCAASDLTVVDHMDAEQDAISTSRNAEPAAGSGSRGFPDDENWLRLGVEQDGRRGGTGFEPAPRKLVELDLFSSKAAAPNPPPLLNAPAGAYSMHPPPPPFYFQPPNGVHDGFPAFRQPEYVWNFRQGPYNSSITWNVPYAQQLSARPGPSSSAMKIVDAPSRPNSGLWFLLQAEQSQIKETLVLPQVQKSYLRIKDGRMTILLIMKYLANKLRLSSEWEVEITCRGQRVLPLLTVQHVRDAIWCPREQWVQEPAPESPATDHVMILNYARSA